MDLKSGSQNFKWRIQEGGQVPLITNLKSEYENVKMADKLTNFVFF